MNNIDKYHYIMNSVMKMVPSDITGTKRRNTKANIKLYVQRKLGISHANNKIPAIVYLGIRMEIDKLLKELE